MQTIAVDAALVRIVSSNSKSENSINLVSKSLKNTLTVQQAPTPVWHPVGPRVLGPTRVPQARKYLQLADEITERNSGMKYGH